MSSSTSNADASAAVREPPKLRGIPLALTLLIVALWGGNVVAVTYSIDWLPPVAVGAVRFALGAIVMLAWCRIEGTTLRIARSETIMAATAAALLFAQIATFNIGVGMTNSTHGVLLINTYIFGVSFIEHFLLATASVRAAQWLGMMVAAVGVFCIVQVRGEAVSSDERPFWPGDILLLFSSALLAVRIVYVRHVVQKMPGSKLIFWHNLLSIILFVAYSATTESLPTTAPPLSAVAGLLYQGLIVAGVCFVIHASLLTRYSASQISVFFFATPVFGVVFSVLLRGEPFNQLIALGAACVAAGIWMARS